MQTNNKNILFLAGWYPNKKKPFLGNFIKRHAEAIALNNKVFVVHYFESTYNKIEIIQNNITEIKCTYKNGILNKYWLFIKSIFYLLNIIKKKKIDLIQLNITYPLGCIAYILNLLSNKKYIICEHWSIYQEDHYKQKNIFFKNINKLIFNKAAGILTVSNQLGNQIKKITTNKNIFKVGNVVDTSIFNLNNNMETKSSTINFIHISTLDQHAKNVLGIIHTFKKAIDQLNNFNLTIIAENDFTTIKELVLKLNLTSNITFKSALTTQEIALEIKAHDCFILFSNYEGLPCVLLESLSCGTPVIATNVGGISEIINDKNGILVVKKNEEELLNAMVFMSKNHNTYNKQEMHKFIDTNFSYLAINNAFNNVYTNIVC